MTFYFTSSKFNPVKIKKNRNKQKISFLKYSAILFICSMFAVKGQATTSITGSDIDTIITENKDGIVDIKRKKMNLEGGIWNKNTDFDTSSGSNILDLSLGNAGNDKLFKTATGIKLMIGGAGKMKKLKIINSNSGIVKNVGIDLSKSERFDLTFEGVRFDFYHNGYSDAENDNKNIVLGGGYKTI